MEITVAGSARASLTPERAKVTLEITDEGYELAQVVDHANAAVAQVAEAVKELAAQSPSPTTWSAVLPLTTSSWVPYDGGQPQATRYTASGVVKVTFQDFQALAAFVTEQGARTGVTVRGVEWVLTDETRAAREADVLGDAVADAHRRAAVIAAAGRGGEVRLVEVADPGLLAEGRGQDSGVQVGMSMRAYSGSEGGNQVEVQPEDVVVEATVHARFVA